MGTSKGYISPTTPKWSSVKRGLSTYLSNPTTSNVKTVASKYANAMNDDKTSFHRVSAIFSNFSAFVNQSKSQGLIQALNDYQLSYIIDLPPEEAIIELVNAFSDGSTIDDNISIACISVALEEIGVISLEDLSNIQMNVFIKELTCQFAIQKFAQMFDKQLKNKCNNIIEANKRMEEIQNYIYNKLMSELSLEKIESIDPLNLPNEDIINQTMEEAFDILENYYG